MKWRNSKERELIAQGGCREQTLPTKHNPNPDLSDPVESAAGGNNAGNGETQPQTPLGHQGSRPLFPFPQPGDFLKMWPGSAGGVPEGVGAADGKSRSESPFEHEDEEMMAGMDEEDEDGAEDEEDEEEISVT